MKTLRCAFRLVPALALCATVAAAQSHLQDAADAAGGTGTVVAVDAILRETLARHPALEAAGLQVAAADARHAGAGAERGPRIELGGRAGHYEGLEDSVLGQGFVIPAVEDQYALGATLKQPVYTGGRVGNQRRGTAFERLAARADARATGADLAYQAKAAYWRWSKAFHARVAAGDAVRRVEAHARDLRNLRAAGLATDHEQLAAEVLADQTALRQEDARRAEETARARIAYLTGRPLPDPARPDGAGSPSADPVPAEDGLIARAVARRPECVAALLRIRSAEAAVKVARASDRPQIAIEARYEYLRPNMMIIPPRDEWIDDAYAGVSASWSLFDSGRTRERVAEASAQAGAARAALALAEEEARLEVREARIALAGAIERSRVAARAEASAGRDLEAATSQWRHGLARSSEVLDAHARLTDAEAQRIAAQADVQIARAALERATGDGAPEAPAAGDADD